MNNTDKRKTLSTEGAIQYWFDVYGLKIARGTIYKKKSTHKDTFPGKRSPFGKLVFDPVEIDRYMLTGSAREVPLKVPLKNDETIDEEFDRLTKNYKEDE